MTNVVIIGYGKMPADCVQIAARNNIPIRFVIESKQSVFSPLEGICRRLGLYFERLVDRGEITERLCAIKDPTVVLSINNTYLFPREVLGKKNLRVVNFHGSLLPSYRGHGDVIPSWVIFNGERIHGATWHLVTERADTGAILAQAPLDLGEGDTALTLMMNVIRRGTQLFDEHLHELLSTDYQGTAQPLASEPALRRTELPANGMLDLNWNFAMACRFLRAMDTGPLRYLPRARVIIEGREFEILAYRSVAGQLRATEVSLAASAESGCNRAMLHLIEGSLELELAEKKSVKSSHQNEQNT